MRVTLKLCLRQGFFVVGHLLSAIRGGLKLKRHPSRQQKTDPKVG